MPNEIFPRNENPFMDEYPEQPSDDNGTMPGHEEELAQQGYSPNEDASRQGYSTNPEAKLAMLSAAFKNARGQEKRVIFNQAFAMARQTGMKEFELGGNRYTTETAEEKIKHEATAHVASKAIEVASSLKQELDKSRAVIHDEPKGVYDMVPNFRDKIMAMTGIDQQSFAPQEIPSNILQHYNK